MARYIVKRVLQGVFVLWAAYTLSFFILYSLPGNAATIAAAASGGLGAPPAALVHKLAVEYGFDKPLSVQYVDDLWKALRLNFGNSVQTGQSATSAVAQVLPHTIALAVLSLVVAVLGGLGLAIASTFPRARWLRQLIGALPSLGVSIPSFWLGLLLLQAFSFDIHWFPALGDDGISSLVLPTVALAIPTGGYIAQLLSRSLRITLEQPYIDQARAKGASETRVHFGHALRNAVIPSLTMVGVLIGNLLAGTVVTETVFSRTGIGRLIVQAVNARDLPEVQVVVIFAALVFVVSSLVVDLIYPLIDRRISLTGTAVTA
ncbi:peptide ABC transporter permease [Frondihabitans sp. PAMC 28766]|uniref:ABC transporter permease n=1 Tax=Frondihabitans sp. PAMC 28766 TaxID=1795630 RepID=UPI00078EF732|nr:ABC transporter permease [Frondihabitans sp. PAMC 28766]AMM21397.1 peptide ABC transporter permease [Frondihabitans sp. PAMC 28766]